MGWSRAWWPTHQSADGALGAPLAGDGVPRRPASKAGWGDGLPTHACITHSKPIPIPIFAGLLDRTASIPYLQPAGRVAAATTVSVQAATAAAGGQSSRTGSAVRQPASGRPRSLSLWMYLRKEGCIKRSVWLAEEAGSWREAMVRGDQEAQLPASKA